MTDADTQPTQPIPMGPKGPQGNPYPKQSSGRVPLMLPAIVAVALPIVVVAIVVGLVIGMRNADEAKVELVEVCVASGGSWVMDGDQGECWQRGTALGPAPEPTGQPGTTGQ